MVQRFVSLVTVCGTSLRCAANVITLYGPSARYDETAPDWSTGRLWLLRIGLAALLRPKVVAEDWVWMIDHSIQIGQCKCLVILGIGRAASRGPAAVPSGHGVDCPGADDQRDQGGRACVPGGCRVEPGVPRAIVDRPRGWPPRAGDDVYAIADPETDEDLRHRAHGSVLARGCGSRRTSDGRVSPASRDWRRSAIQQEAELAFLVPPGQRSKAPLHGPA